MTESRFSRRAFVTAVGAAAAGTALSGQAAAASGWETAETPTENSLYDVADTVENEYAVGGGGVVLERTSEGWEKVLDGGPTGNANTLKGADTTDDGERLWFVGNSGAIGEYDVTTGDLTDRSAPTT